MSELLLEKLTEYSIRNRIADASLVQHVHFDCHQHWMHIELESDHSVRLHNVAPIRKT